MTTTIGHHYRKFSLATLLLAICILVSGCGATSSLDKDQSSGFTDAAGIQKEYKESIKKLTYPKGYTPPSSLQGLQASSFQRGYGDNLASYDWMCAWEKDWLNNYGSNKAQAQEALAQLSKSTDMPFLSAAQADDSTRRFIKNNLDKAKLGDPSGIQQDIKANCS